MDGARLEAQFRAAQRLRALARRARLRRLRRAVAHEAGVHAVPRQFAAEPAELDLQAAVHDDLDARPPRRLRRRRVVADAELHPHHLGADRDRVIDDRADLVRRAEDVDQIDRLGDVAQRGVDGLAEQRLAGEAGVDRDDAVALALQVAHDEGARPVPVGRGADHRDGARPLQDAAQPARPNRRAERSRSCGPRPNREPGRNLAMPVGAGVQVPPRHRITSGFPTAVAPCSSLGRARSFGGPGRCGAGNRGETA